MPLTSLVRYLSDSQTSQHVFRVVGNKHGIFIRDGRPKTAAETLRRSWLVPGVDKRYSADKIALP
jgi:hypothetical protein